MKTIRTSAIAAAIALCAAAPLFAQTERAYVTGVGGVARSTDTTSGDAMAEVGVRIAPHLLAFGDVGRFQNLQPSDVQTPIAATTSQLSASQGLSVIGTGSVPAWYSIGGLRFEVPLQGRVQPYVFGGAGFARLMPTAQFTLSSGTLPDGTAPALGTDVTDQLETSGAFTAPAASTAFMYSLGGGIEVPVARHWAVDAGYRYSRINADTPANVQGRRSASGIGSSSGYRTLLLVAPGRRLRARDDPGDIGIDALRGGGRFGRAPLLGFQPARGFLLLLFLFRAFARSFVLCGSGLLH
jgi:opacity protein-like surface antigen